MNSTIISLLGSATLIALISPFSPFKTIDSNAPKEELVFSSALLVPTTEDFEVAESILLTSPSQTEDRRASFLEMPACSGNPGTIAGFAWEDFNFNGIKEANETFGIQNLTISIFDEGGAQVGSSATTDIDGNWSIDVSGSSSTTFRVEYTGLPTWASETGNGANGNTLVQFVAAGDCANLGVGDPSRFTTGTTNTSLYVSCFANGDPLGGGSSGADEWFVGFPYGTNSGAPAQTIDGTTIGSTYGQAFSQQSQEIFLGAFLRRYSGLGTLGSGGIYLLEPTATSFDATEFYDLDANGIRTRADETDAATPAYGSGTSYQLDAANQVITYLGATDPVSGQPIGLGVVGSNTERALNADQNVANNDPAAFDQVGKVGLGDVEISDDGKFLYVTNLYARSVVRLELDDAANPTAVVNTTTWNLDDIPSVPTCTDGVLRPFALSYHRDKLYIGAVCTGENAVNTASNSNLVAYVFELDDPKGTGSFAAAPVVTQVLDYNKGKSRGSQANVFPNNNWNTWTNDHSANSQGPGQVYPTPWLTDIEFTDYGNMVINLGDRAGYQFGNNNRTLVGGNLSNYQLGGHMLFAERLADGSYEVESDGRTTNFGVDPAIRINGEGPGSSTAPGPDMLIGGEFFSGAFFGNSINNQRFPPNPFAGNHPSTVMGSSTVVPGTDEVYITAMDPDALFSGGTLQLSATDGGKTIGSGYNLYSGGGLNSFSKSAGLGDLEASIERDVPIEIGNYVWEDTDNDGIQDPDEPGIDGLTVELWADDGMGGFMMIASTTTVNGNYGFSNLTSGATAGVEYNVTGLQPNTNYELRFPTTSGMLDLTSQDSGGADAGGDLRDSDADTGGVVAFSTTGAGRNNLNFDVGYSSVIMPPVETSICDCKEYVYLNETSSGGKVHKYEIMPDGSLNEVLVPLPGGGNNAWYPGTDGSQLPSPHGLGVDLNGFLYIGSAFSNDNASIRRLTCAGEIFPETGVGGFDIDIPRGALNILTIDNTIYANIFTRPADGSVNDDRIISAFDACTGDLTATACLDGSTGGFLDWGFYYDERTGFFYSTEENSISPLWRYTVDDFSPVGTPPTCVAPFIEAGPDNEPSVGDRELPRSGLFGITTDEDGNIYLVNGQNNQRSRIIKYDASGAFVAASDYDEDDTDGAGWFSSRGIVYSETSQQLYVSTTSPNDDCVYRFDRDVMPLGFGVPPNGDLAQGNPAFGQAKGIAISTECCPTSPTQTINLVECYNSSTEIIFLNEIFPCDGIICEAQWTPADAASTNIFESCNQSIMPNAPGCYTFTRASDGMGSNQCGAFNQTLTVEVIELPEVTAAGDQVLNCGDISTDLTATTTGNIIRWEQNTTSCLSDEWEAIPGTEGLTSYNPGILSETTNFRAVIGGSSTGVDSCPGGDCELVSECITVTLPDDCPDPPVGTYDLALTKTLSPTQDNPVNPGDEVDFIITVSNQGDVDAGEITITDYIPDGMSLTGTPPNLFIGWVESGDNATLTITGPTVAEGSLDFPLTLTVDAGFVGTSLVNNAEITADAGDDIDSVPGDNGGDDRDPNDDSTDDGNDDPDMQDPNDDDFDGEDITVMQPVTVSLGSTVFEDPNNNGQQDSGEDGIEGVLVVLFMEGGDGATDGADDTPIVTGADGILGTPDDAFGPDGMMGTADDGEPGMFTNAAGNYFFGNLMEGDYYVQIPASEFGTGSSLEDLPLSSNTSSGTFAGETDPDDDNLDGDDEGLQMGSGTVTTSNIITLAAGSEPTDADTETAQGNDQDNAPDFVDEDGNMTLDFGFFAPVSVGDTAFVDLDEDGLQTPGEPGIGGVIVTLLDSNGDVVIVDADGNTITGVTMTDADGSYLFDNLPPGEYSVVFDISTADNAEFYDFTTPNAGDDADDSDNTTSLTDDTAQSDPTAFLNSGEQDLTLDVGVVCAVEITLPPGQTSCSTQPIDLVTGVFIEPASLGGSWMSSGDGTFLDATGAEISTGPFVFGTAVQYVPGSVDIANGAVMLTLTTDDPDGPCGPVSATLTTMILKVDCGDFPWEGN